MTGEGIYLIQEDGALLELTEQPYESEEVLQRLLERYPSLLAGRQGLPRSARDRRPAVGSAKPGRGRGWRYTAWL
jgi:hypothetical protein